MDERAAPAAAGLPPASRRRRCGQLGRRIVAVQGHERAKALVLVRGVRRVGNHNGPSYSSSSPTMTRPAMRATAGLTRPRQTRHAAFLLNASSTSKGHWPGSRFCLRTGKRRLSAACLDGSGRMARGDIARCSCSYLGRMGNPWRLTRPYQRLMAGSRWATYEKAISYTTSMGGSAGSHMPRM